LFFDSNLSFPGHLITGILIRNISPLTSFFQIDPSWSRVITQFAFILILIRCGLNLDANVLRRSLAILTSLGLVSTTIEGVAILVVAYFLLDIPMGLAIVFR
jgi:NhaP-type Na+/H+ or K+/H+ antiporter